MTIISACLEIFFHSKLTWSLILDVVAPLAAYYGLRQFPNKRDDLNGFDDSTCHLLNPYGNSVLMSRK